MQGYGDRIVRDLTFVLESLFFIEIILEQYRGQAIDSPTNRGPRKSV